MADLFGRKGRYRKVDPDTAKTQYYSYDADGRVTAMKPVKGRVHFPVKYHLLTVQEVERWEANLSRGRGEAL